MHVQPLSSKAKAVSINTPASELMTIDGNQAAAIIAQLQFTPLHRPRR